MSAQVTEAAAPDAWFDHMRAGRWEDAWRIKDAQMATRRNVPCWHWPRHEQYVWTGERFDDRRVLVRCYHGLGDTIQFIRFMPTLRERAREVIVWAQPGLLPLLATVKGVDRLLPLHEGAPEADFDVDVEIMELPHAFRTTLDAIPASVPYLHASPLPMPRDRSRPAVGLVWKAGTWDVRRSIAYPKIRRLLAIGGIDWFVLQPDAHASGWQGDAGQWPGELNLLDHARAVKSMDLLITIDSMPAHVAGALGVPVWTLLPHDADWRWMADRDDSPWYPTMRLFRQREPGEWSPVIARISDELASFTRDRTG
ncbi:hypothetical protein [Lysobacter arvi]|uniref:ADP-heptose--LPS heptosyltransferase n=1 Tax=Lysobacter arvi TaxID=3038776 RepID=A0ABU1CBS0_9GAMM|nr:hypothetical protein [Lysobacter arvi]MDR0182631.1 hypothetical protein [Lysobacter arvi]